MQAAALFFGVLLLETGSSHFNFLLCLLTIVTISISLWTIADMDLPFSSTFHRVRFESLSVQLVSDADEPKASKSAATFRKALRTVRAATRASRMHFLQESTGSRSSGTRRSSGRRPTAGSSSDSEGSGSGSAANGNACEVSLAEVSVASCSSEPPLPAAAPA